MTAKQLASYAHKQGATETPALLTAFAKQSADIVMEEITPEQVQGYYDELQARGLFWAGP